MTFIFRYLLFAESVPMRRWIFHFKEAIFHLCDKNELNESFLFEKQRIILQLRVYHSLPVYDQWNRLKGTLCIYCRKENFEMDIDGQGYGLKPGSIAICQSGSPVRFTDDSRNLEFVLILLLPRS